MYSSIFFIFVILVGVILVDVLEWNRQWYLQMLLQCYCDVYFCVLVLFIICDWFFYWLIWVLLWVLVDLCDGNQVLVELMDLEWKWFFFELMVVMGYKEIEVGYFFVLQMDYDFVCLIVEFDIVFEDVMVVVFMLVWWELIWCMVEFICGMCNFVVVYMYIVIVLMWCDVVFGYDWEGLKRLIFVGGCDVWEFVGELLNVWFEFFFEVFNFMEFDYVFDVCDVMIMLWDVIFECLVILNFLVIVEIVILNVYVDQIEYMYKNFDCCDVVILLVYFYND